MFIIQNRVQKAVKPQNWTGEVAAGLRETNKNICIIHVIMQRNSLLSRIKCQPRTQNLKVNAKHEKMRKSLHMEIIPSETETYTRGIQAICRDGRNKTMTRCPGDISHQFCHLRVQSSWFCTWDLFCKATDLNVQWNPEDIRWYLAHLTAEMLLYY